MIAFTAQSSPSKSHDTKVEQDIDLAIERARLLADSAGKRLTPVREHVYKVLLEASQPLGAYEILETLDDVGAKEPPTAYRCLEWLMELGLARRIVSLSKFVAAPIDPNLTSVAYLLCHECGMAEAVDIAELGNSLQVLVKAQGFKSDATVIELTGLCRGHQV